MRIIFMGTPDFAVPVLAELIAQGHDIAAVYTRAPTPAGRGMAERRSPVHTRAAQLGLPVRHPANFREHADIAEFSAWNADVGVVVAYGLILPQKVLDSPRLGCLNLHASLLPRWRGAAPIQRAIMAGDSASGVMVMRMEAGLDTGPVGMAERVEITEEMTGSQLHDKLSHLGADLMARALRAYARDSLEFIPQASQGVTYARKIEKAECRIDFNQPATAVHNHIRGLSQFPGAFFEGDFGKGKERLKVLLSQRVEGAGSPGEALPAQGVIACREGAIQLLNVQRAGKSAMRFEEVARGMVWPTGARFA